MWAVRNFTLMGCGCDWVGVAGGMNKHLSTRVCVCVCACVCVSVCFCVQLLSVHGQNDQRTS